LSQYQGKRFKIVRMEEAITKKDSTKMIVKKLKLEILKARK
jgi:hypothetical protein